jgi:cytochrome c5
MVKIVRPKETKKPAAGAVAKTAVKPKAKKKPVKKEIIVEKLPSEAPMDEGAGEIVFDCVVCHEPIPASEPHVNDPVLGHMHTEPCSHKLPTSRG